MISSLKRFLSLQKELFSLLATKPEPEIDFSDYSEQLSGFTDTITKSVIAGEFYNIEAADITSINKEFEDFKNEIRKIFDGKFLIQSYVEEYLIPLLDEIYRILSQFLTVISHFKSVGSNYTYYRIQTISTSVGDLKELVEYCNLFILEYGITDDIKFYEDLESCLRRGEIQRKTFSFRNFSIFEHKVRFLQYKWLKRRVYDITILKNVLGEAYNEKYIFDNEIVDLKKEVKIGKQYYPFYEDWIDRINYHYFDELKPSDYKEIDAPDYESYESLYFLVKFYKDTEPSLKELAELEPFFKNFSNTKASEFTKKKNLLYYYNNYFSLLTKNKSVDDELVKGEYHKINKLYKTRESNNFFIYYKYLKLKIREAQKFLKENTAEKIDISVINDLLIKCKNNFEWTKLSLNRLYDLDYESCILEFGEDRQRVYHPSSFILALSVDENLQRIKEAESDVQKLETDLFQKKSNLSLEALKDSIGSNEKKLTETISIFTAIIGFIVGSIGSFKFIETFSESLLFITIFGTSISIFVLLIFASSKGLIALKKNWYILLFYPINSKLDSLNTISSKKINEQQKIIDSLKMKMQK